MAQETYTHALKVQIGRVLATAMSDDYFPIVGTNVNISASTKWAKTSEWQLQDGSGQTVTQAGTIVLQKDGKTVLVTAEGELKQIFIARNPLSETTVQKTVYAMRPQPLPYFDVVASKEIIRTDGEGTTLRTVPENGYSGNYTATVRVFKENEETSLMVIPATPVSGDTPNVKAVNFSLTERGIYDVEVDVTDITSGITFSKRINKLVTAMPRLAPEPSDRESGYRDIFATRAYTTYSGKSKIDFFIRLWENTGEGLSYAELAIPAGEQNDTCYYDTIDVSVLPGGTTLVLRGDPNEPDVGYARRLIFKGNNPISVSNASGTPNFSWEKPLIITINQDTAYHVPFKFYSGLTFENNCRHIVLDGRGYKNISKGIHIHKYSQDVFGETCIFLVNGSGDVELAELELSDCDFTGIMAKTDPDPNRPWYWFGNWEMHNMFLHHTHIHDTHGEGFYIGYFTPGMQNKNNSSGEQVSFRPHALINTKIYRNLLENMGYDGMQLSNARGAEVCYNEVYNASWRGDKDQCSGISIQSMSGKCYNNIVHKFNGSGIQIGPLGDLEVFNNVVYDCPEGQPGVMFLFSVDIPEQNPNGDDINDTIKMYLHNNVIVCNGVAFNGRNTVQVRGLYAEDNIVVYKTSKFGNMATDTLAQWEAQSSGNTWIRQGVLDFVAIDAYKIADSANGNYQLAADSPLIQSGTGSKFKFDFRGYKNWFGTVSPTGAYMGVYKSANINDEPISLTGVSINGGAASTRGQVVSVELTYTGAATRCRIGEVADLLAASWVDIPAGGIVEYTLSEGFGQKTVYAQVGAGSQASEIKSDAIEYQSTPISLDDFIINDGKINSRHLTVPIAFTYSGSFAPSKYRLGEVADLSAVAWLDMAEVITYTFASMGQKTLYGQLQDKEGSMTDIKSASLNIEQLARKAIVSLGWGLLEIPNNTDGLSIFDGETGITRFQSQQTIAMPRKIYDTTGELLGTAVPSSISSNMVTPPAQKGAVTGDNSGVYPDVYLEHSSVYGGNSAGDYHIAFTLPGGTYKVRVFTNTLWVGRVTPNNALSYKTVTATSDVALVLPASGVQNNTANLTEPVTVTVSDDGLLRVSFGISGVSKDYYYAPLNIIEIEEV